jgi:catechol 2,3-dioxygenase-like lactoylglutathione lyase family enzyme
MRGILGLHHVTAISRDPNRTIDFYTRTLGLRLVKQTVNFDDPSTYHFYFGDATGAPGSLITVFPWPYGVPGRPGPGQITVTALAVPPASIGFWISRLLQSGISYRGPESRWSGGDRSERVLAFRDPDGLMLEIVGDPGAEERAGWTHVPGIPAEHAVRGLHSVTTWVAQAGATVRLLTETLGFHEVRAEGSVQRFASGHGGPGTLIDVRSVGGFPAAEQGPGTVHHVAWAVADDVGERLMRTAVQAAGLDPTPVINRLYFNSVYFREPGGVLFELATGGPGFTLDEPVDHLGERLMLPGDLEPRRTAIEAALPRLS